MRQVEHTPKPPLTCYRVSTCFITVCAHILWSLLIWVLFTRCWHIFSRSGRAAAGRSERGEGDLGYLFYWLPKQTANTMGDVGCGVWGCLADLYNACVAQLSNESKRIGSPMLCPLRLPLPLPLFHPHPLVTSVARSTTNPSPSPCCLQHHVTRVSRVANWFSTLGHVF